MELDQLIAQARAAHRGGDVTTAKSLYRSLLDADSKHLVACNELAVLCTESGQMFEAASLFLRACDLAGWRDPVIRRNLLLALVHSYSSGVGAFQLSDQGRRYREADAVCAVRPANERPLVSVVIVHEGDAIALDRCIESVLAQTYSRLEIVVASYTGTSTRGATGHGASGIPVRYLASAHPHVAAVLNAGASAAAGDDLQFLFERDRISPGHIDRMVQQVSSRGQTLGFAGVAFVNDLDEELDRFSSQRVFEASCTQAAVGWHETRGFGFIAENPAIAPGNLYVARDFFVRLGGFAQLHYHFLWDFMLRAVFEAEPVYVPGSSYRYHVPQPDATPAELQAQIREVVPMLAGFAERAFTDSAANPWAPTHGNWGPLFVARILGSPLSELVTPARLRQLVDDLGRFART